jgi:hypothetical protein
MHAGSCKPVDARSSSISQQPAAARQPQLFKLSDVTQLLLL